MSYNIRTAFADEEDALLHNDWPRRKPIAIQMLKDLNPDVIAIQEATDSQVTDLKPGFTVLRQEELALLYRAERLEAVEGGYITLGIFGHPDPWGARWALWEIFRVREDGRTFLMVMTHLSTAKDQVPQAEQVIALAVEKGGDHLPAVVLGDFNFDASILLAARGFSDAVQDKKGTFHAFKGGRKGKRLDVIGVKGFRVLQAVVDTRRAKREGTWVYPSDHFVVMATLVPKNPEAKPTP
jgi:endonuclease/exonuclease/phosphatase family metal-dependent hydrolase